MDLNNPFLEEGIDSQLNYNSLLMIVLKKEKLEKV